MDFLLYFGNVFEPISLLLLLAGTIGGLILGAMPGLSPTMAVALLIPFTFHMEATHGLILLGATYTSTVAGGAVSAILLKIPGAPANIATVLDGHQMAKKGEGKRALQLSFLSSMFGGVFGIALLITLTPLLARWVLAFGPSELFWLAILGVTIVGSLDQSSVVKGLISGCIGFWLSLIGYDDVQGVERFIFVDALTGGINIIPALIGLFAIPQVLEMMARTMNKQETEILKVFPHPLMVSLREIRTYFRSLSIGAAVGSVVGLIPGVGGQIAGLVSYEQSRRLSKDPSRFGSGNPEGIIAAESANNAMVGPSLVPLLTLSIPGSPTAAVLLGGLLIHGLFPGGALFTDHPDVVWTFIDSMLIGQVLMAAFGLYIAGLATRVSQIPPAIMAACVLTLSVFGAYSVQQSQGDVTIMLALGIAMFLLEKIGFSAAPLVLGLILGPIAEKNFVQGSYIAKATDGAWSYFFTGGLNLVLIFLVACSLFFSFLPVLSRKRQKPKTVSALPLKKNRIHRYPILLVTPEIVMTIISAVVAVISFSQGESNAFMFPKIFSFVFLILSCWALMSRFPLSADNTPLPDISFRVLSYILPGMTLAVAYVYFLSEFIGFYVSSAVIFLLMLILYDTKSHRKPKHWIFRLVLTVCFMSMVYAMFKLVLKVQTPLGVWF